MTVAYVGAGTPRGGGASSNTNLQAHASTAAGDLLVIIAHSGGGTVSSITGGSGSAWTMLGSVATPGALTNLSVWTKIAAAGDLAVNFTTTFSTSTQYRLDILSFSGSSHYAASFVSTSSASGGTAITSPNYDMGAGIAVAVGGGDTFAGSPTCTVTGSGWTERSDNVNATLITLCVATGTTTGSGLAGATFTWTASHAQRGAITFVVIEPSTGNPLFFGTT